jgi:hypothetical protein
MTNEKRRRFLVVARVGDMSLHKHWLGEPGVPRNWDLSLNAFGSDLTRVQDGDLPLVIDRGTRMDSLARQFRAQPELFERYDYILTPDDDMLLGPSDFDRLFEISVEHDLAIAQMSLTHDSYFSHPIVLNVPGLKLRYSNFVEGMTTCFKSSYLRRLIPLFEHHSTGWGVDLVWALTMPDPAFKAAIVDAVQAKHTRAMKTGPLYKQLGAEGRNPEADVDSLTKSFVNFQRGMMIYGAITSDGRRMDASGAARRNAISLLKNATKTNQPMPARRIAMVLARRSILRAGFRPKGLVPKADAPDWLVALCAGTE